MIDGAGFGPLHRCAKGWVSYNRRIELNDLQAEHQRLGAIVHLATVTSEGEPHVAQPGASRPSRPD